MSKKKVKKAKRTVRKKTKTPRSAQILKVIGKKKNVTLGDIVNAIRVKSEDKKYYASTILRMVEQGLVKRREKGGLWVYRAA